MDWADWRDTERYDRIIGSDILYSAEMHVHLRCIFETNLAEGGRLLLSDPFRASGLKLLEEIEQTGWTVTIGKWMIGDAAGARPIGIFDFARA